MRCRCRSDNRASRGSSRDTHLATAYLPMLHCHMQTFSSLMFYVCFANVAQRLRARAGSLGPKREPDDNDEVCSHPANETPRSAPSLHAMQISLTPAMNQTQCFSSQHFSKAIIHKGHAKGTLALATSTRGAATLGGEKRAGRLKGCTTLRSVDTVGMLFFRF